MTSKTLGELARLIGGDYIGNPDQPVTQVIHPALANGPEDMALVLDKGILPLLAQKPVATALVPEGLDVPGIPNQLRVKRPKVALAKLLDIFDKPAYAPPGIHPSAVVDSSAQIADGVTIGPLCIVGPNTVIGSGSRLLGNVFVGENVVIGDNCLFYPGVYVGDRVEAGNRVILHPNASIGSDGFSHVTPEAGSVELSKVSASDTVKGSNTEIIRINSIGTVVLEDDVEIGANGCVDRGTLGETRIKKGTKIDNMCQVAHNVTVGENCLFAAHAGIAGSTKVGNRVVIGGKAGIPDHVSIGDDAIIMPMTGISQNVPEKTIMLGMPGVPRREFFYKEMSIKRVKGLGEKVKDLTRQVEALQARLDLQKEEQPV